MATSPGTVQNLQLAGRLSGVAVPLFLAVLLGFNLPVGLYLRNQDFIATPAPRIALLALGGTAALALLFVLPTLLLGRRWGERATGGLAALGAIAFFHNLLPLGTKQLLDGSELIFSFSPIAYVASVVGSLALLGLFLVGYRRLRAPIQLAAALVAAVFFVTPAIQLWGLPEKPADPEGTSFADISALSPERNILMILMDSLQSDVLAELLAAHPERRAGLEGFVLYEDALGAAATTYMTMPALLAGQVYDGRSPLREFYVDRVAQGTFLTQLARAGWHVTHVHPMIICEEGVQECTEPSILMRSPWAVALREYAKLLDLGILNASPYPLRRGIYHRGDWLARRLLDGGDYAYLAQSIRLLERFTAALNTESPTPTLKLVHLMNTHPPFALDERCQERRPKRSREAYQEQILCGLDRFLALLDKLRELGVYGRTAVFLLADTGVTQGWRQAHRGAVAHGASPEEAERIGNASPTLLVKRPGDTGSFRISSAPVQLTDVPGTVCRIAAACERSYGASLSDVRVGEARRRRYVDYEWTNDSWGKERLLRVDLYDVVGSAQRSSSWELRERILTERNVAAPPP